MRIFKIGSTLITETEDTQHLSLEEMRAILARTYPEIAHATLRESTTEDGSTLIHVIPAPGRKG
jgi:hypothetical protein